MPRELDMAWDHCTVIDKAKKKVKCNYCERVIHGGIARFKCHLAAKKGEVKPCEKCGAEVRKVMRDYIMTCDKSRKVEKQKREAALQSLNRLARVGIDDEEGIDISDDSDDSGDSMERTKKRKTSYLDEERRQNKVGGSRGLDTFLYKSEAATQKTLKGTWCNKESTEKVGRAVTKFLLYCGISFNAADCPYYQPMIDVIAEAGTGIKGPTPYEIRGKYLLKEVDEINGYIASLKKNWSTYGCTLMCDGWTTRTRKNLINFMVYCNRDMIFLKSIDASGKKKDSAYLLELMENVIEEIGEENVVQIISDNERSFASAGRDLMLRKPNLFWIPCSAHSIDLILEDFGALPSISKPVEEGKMITRFIYGSNSVVNLMKTFTKDREILRPGITRFATQFIALQSLLQHQAALKQLMSSNEWLALPFQKDRKKRAEGRKIADLVLTQHFWARAEEACKVLEPLVKVLRILDQDKKPTLSVVYEAMERASEAIRMNVRNHQQYLSIINKRWADHLKSDIHLAAYYLNPQTQYENNLAKRDDLFLATKRVIKRLEQDLTKQGDAIDEIRRFTEAREEFGDPLTRQRIKSSLPADWWSNYGHSAPNLRRIAIKVLSQTSSSSGCERNWSTFELIHTRPRNRLKMELLEKLVHVHSNMRLRFRNSTRRTNDDYYNPINLDDIYLDDDVFNQWLDDQDDPLLNQDDLDWVDEHGEEFMASIQQQDIGQGEGMNASNAHGKGGNVSTGHGLDLNFEMDDMGGQGQTFGYNPNGNNDMVMTQGNGHGIRNLNSQLRRLEASNVRGGSYNIRFSNEEFMGGRLGDSQPDNVIVTQDSDHGSRPSHLQRRGAQIGCKRGGISFTRGRSEELLSDLSLTQEMDDGVRPLDMERRRLSMLARYPSEDDETQG